MKQYSLFKLIEYIAIRYKYR